MAHIFDQFGDVTNLEALKAFSDKPLRKSMRVNTLKSSAEEFRLWTQGKNWDLTPVPWCNEGFFIDRENREEALGKDLLHLLGHAYMQEAASMLPVELLQPEPGETILDMSAAPGSKTTQIAAKLQGRGVVIANDVQEKRLWTLKSALHRSGAHTNIVVKKVGQWYAKHMTERFDRVLCDAPCTAMGTARKDSDALNYCSLENTKKMAKLQVELLQSAIDACKVGGRIVYSTCTLTAEENEGVIHQILLLNKGKIEIIHPKEVIQWDCSQAISDSNTVQEKILGVSQQNLLPLIRLWPQTYDTEGFFCAVIKKTASTRDPQKFEWMPFQEQPLSKRKKDEIQKQISQRYGADMFDETDRLLQRDQSLILATDDVLHCDLPVQDYALGIPAGKILKDGRVLIDHDVVTLRGKRATENVCELDDEQLALLLDAKDSTCDPMLNGHVIVRYKGIPIGLGLAKDGHLKNNLPRWIVRFG